MSNVVSLLSESQWQGVNLKGLFEARAIPHAERISASGPDISVSARAAQSLSLLFFELASHSDEGLSLVGKHPNIVAQWGFPVKPRMPYSNFAGRNSTLANPQGGPTAISV